MFLSKVCEAAYEEEALGIRQEAFVDVARQLARQKLELLAGGAK
jgi:hypothetical protein